MALLELNAWAPTDFIYLDPPYLQSTRRSQERIYRHELMRPEEHARLLDLVVSSKAMVAISGYPSELYEQRLERLAPHRIPGLDAPGGSHRMPVVQLPRASVSHDYSHLGANKGTSASV